MAQPVVYNWVYNAVIAPAQAALANVPLSMVPNALAGVSARITINSSQSESATFIVVGLDTYLQPYPPESLPMTSGTVTSINYYGSILSITPQTAPLGNITVVTSNVGNTKPFLCDVWNKEALYAFTVDNFVGASPVVNITPQYRIAPIPVWEDQGLSGQQPTYSGSNWYPFVNANPPPAFPIVTNIPVSFNVPDMPMTAMRFVIGAGNNVSFTATVLQQGGYY